MERTLAILIKPDAVAARPGRYIIQRIEEAGFQIRAMRMLHLSGREARGLRVHRERPFFGSPDEVHVAGPGGRARARRRRTRSRSGAR